MRVERSERGGIDADELADARSATARSLIPDASAALDRMKKSLMHDGYIHAEAEVVRRLDNEAKTLGLLAEVRPTLGATPR